MSTAEPDPPPGNALDPSATSERLLSILEARGNEVTQTVHVGSPPAYSEFLERKRLSPTPEPSSLSFTPRYVDVTNLAEGGMGLVYLARDKDLGRSVVLKSPRQELSQRRFSLFVREARITAQLTHPHIMSVFDLGIMDGGAPFFSMPFVKGNTLASLLKAKPLDTRLEQLETFIDIFLKVCDAVSFAHSRGVVHCDIKPHNIMVGEFGEVRLADWGLSKVLKNGHVDGGYEDLSADKETFFAGTPAYMSPEQLAGSWSAVSQASDVFALGGLLLEILTDECPNPKSDKFEPRGQKQRAKTKTLTKKGIPLALCEICDRALEFHPEHRFASVQHLSAAVRNARQRRARGMAATVYCGLLVGALVLGVSLTGMVGTLAGILAIHWSFWAALLCVSFGLTFGSTSEAFNIGNPFVTQPSNHG